jgi:hypothetical protein
VAGTGAWGKDLAGCLGGAGRGALQHMWAWLWATGLTIMHACSAMCGDVLCFDR